MVNQRVRQPAARGFAAMDRDLQRRIASRGGRAAHQAGTAHEWTSQEAAEAGRKGGRALHKNAAHGESGKDENKPTLEREVTPDTGGASDSKTEAQLSQGQVIDGYDSEKQGDSSTSQ